MLGAVLSLVVSAAGPLLEHSPPADLPSIAVDPSLTCFDGAGLRAALAVWLEPDADLGHVDIVVGPQPEGGANLELLFVRGEQRSRRVLRDPPRDCTSQEQLVSFTIAVALDAMIEAVPATTTTTPPALPRPAPRAEPAIPPTPKPTVVGFGVQLWGGLFAGTPARVGASGQLGVVVTPGRYTRIAISASARRVAGVATGPLGSTDLTAISVRALGCGGAPWPLRAKTASNLWLGACGGFDTGRLLTRGRDFATPTRDAVAWALATVGPLAWWTLWRRLGLGAQAAAEVAMVRTTLVAGNAPRSARRRLGAVGGRFMLGVGIRVGQVKGRPRSRHTASRAR